jgi:sigma-B regulation protein RsbU (phosphoserine phosphatase)
MPNIRTAMNRGAIDFLTKPIDFGDLEITIRNTLGHVVQMRHAIDSHEQLVAIQHELGVAARIQESILPRKFPPFPERMDFELHAAMVPAKEVGGDLFDFFLLDEDHLGLVLGDVSGKGVPAALFMAVSRTLLRATAQHKLSPGDCLNHVNATLAAQNPSHMFVTMFYGILNTRTGEMQFANGGHNPPYLFTREGQVRELSKERNGMIVGLIEAARYQTDTVQIAPGEGLLVFTDGVTEAMDAKEDFYGEERLERLLAERGAASAEELVKVIHGEVNAFATGMPQADDITVMAMRYLGR